MIRALSSWTAFHDGIDTRLQEHPLRVVPRQSMRPLEVPLRIAYVPEEKRELAERRV